MQVFINSSKISCFDYVRQSCFVIYNDEIYSAARFWKQNSCIVMKLFWYTLPLVVEVTKCDVRTVINSARIALILVASFC